MKKVQETIQVLAAVVGIAVAVLNVIRQVKQLRQRFA